MLVGVKLVPLALVTVLLAAGQTGPSVPAVPPDAQPSFSQWLSELIEDARARGYDDAVIDATLRDVQPLPPVVASDRNQAELTLTLDRYIASRLTPLMVRRGRDMARTHRALLERLERSYGVPRQYLLAIWGLESRYGRAMGRTPVFQALATLAWEPRRATFFRGQLFDALTMVARGDIDASTMTGSWAGAMGQTQFMPSSYLQYAVDFDGDGHRDIWRSTPDALASIANYLKGYGWEAGGTWGREVRLDQHAVAAIDGLPRREDGCYAIRTMTTRQPLETWRQLGVRLASGKPLPRGSVMAALAVVGTRTFLTYPNYEALLGYNCAHFYGLSVAMLADRLR